MLVGVFTKDLGNARAQKELDNNLTSMISLSLHRRCKTDEYISFPIAVARIHTGAFDESTQPHTFNVKQNKFALFFDGKILSVKGIKDEDLGRKRDVEIIEQMLQKVPLDKLLHKINGTFVGVLINLTAEEIVLFNDKHGTRYLFYGKWKNGLIFSSEVKAWKNIRGFEKKIDWTAVIDFLKFGYILSEHTLVHGIRKMPNASIIKYNGKSGRLSVAQYWDYNYKEQYEGKDEEYFINEFSHRIKAAVKRCFMRTSGTLGANLSGGIDTRLILSAISPLDKRRIICCTYGEEDCKEFKIAKKLAEIKCVKHVCITHLFDKMGSLVKDTVWLSDPGTTTCWNSYLPFVSDILSDKYKISIILTGVEGNWLYGGSIFGRITKFNSYFRRYWKLCNCSLPESFEKWSARSGFTNQELLELFKPNIQVVKDRLADSIKFLREKSAKANSKHPVNTADYLFLTPNPPNIDATGVITRHWMEDIPLMFDDDLIELYLEMPPKYRCSDFRITALRKIDPLLAKVSSVHDVFVPVNTPKFMAFFTRILNVFMEKVTFFLRIFSHGKVDLRKHIRIKHLDFDALLRVHLRRHLNDILLDKKTLSRPFFNGTYLKKIVTDFLNFKSVSAKKIAILLSFELWLRSFIDKEN